MRSRQGRAIYYSVPIFIILLSLSLIPSRNIEKLFIELTGEFIFVVVFFLAVFGGCEFIVGEIKENTIQFLFTKPLKTEEIILSKWISLNLVIITTLFLYLIIFHIAGFAIFQKYFFKMDLSFATIFLSTLLVSSFTFFLSSIYPSISTGVFIIVFGTGLIEFFLKNLLDAKTFNIYGLLAKKIGTYLLYLLFYIFPSYQNVALKPDEFLWSKVFWYNYSKYFIYAIFGTIFYLLLSIYIFGLKRKSYFKSI